MTDIWNWTVGDGAHKLHPFGEVRPCQEFQTQTVLQFSKKGDRKKIGIGRKACAQWLIGINTWLHIKRERQRVGVLRRFNNEGH